MPKIIRKLLSARQKISIESIVAEDVDAMRWLSELYSDPHVKIINEDSRNLATHVLFIVKYAYPEDYEPILEQKRERIFASTKHAEDEFQQYNDITVRKERNHAELGHSEPSIGLFQRKGERGTDR